jgi:hypothetical protein
MGIEDNKRIARRFLTVWDAPANSGIIDALAAPVCWLTIYPRPSGSIMRLPHHRTPQQNPEPGEGETPVAQRRARLRKEIRAGMQRTLKH